MIENIKYMEIIIEILDQFHYLYSFDWKRLSLILQLEKQLLLEQNTYNHTPRPSWISLDNPLEMLLWSNDGVKTDSGYRCFSTLLV